MAESNRQRRVKVVERSSAVSNWHDVTSQTVTLPTSGVDERQLAFEPIDETYPLTKKRVKTQNLNVAFQSYSGDTRNDIEQGVAIYGAGVVCSGANLKINQYYQCSSSANAAIDNKILGLRILRMMSSYGTLSVQMYTHNSSTYPPYILDVLDDILVTPTNMSPSVFADVTKPQTLSWDISTDIGEDGNYRTQKSASIQWTTDGGTTKTINVGTEQEYTVPANTFPANSGFKWRVKMISDDDVDSGWSEWVTVSTTDVAGTVRSLSPDNVVVDGEIDNRFSWIYNNSYGTEPTQYDIEISTTNGTSWTVLKTENTSNCFADIPANSLPSGNIRYRVRAYSQSGIPSEWAVANITVRARPAKPSITSVSTNTDRPTVTWESVGQEAYELGIYSADNVLLYSRYAALPGRSHHITKRLDNGTYIARLKIRNEYNRESLAAERQFTLAVKKPSAPRIYGEALLTHNRLNFVSSTDKAVLLRDGVAIADVSGMSTYDDYAAPAVCEYRLRALGDTAFCDSEPLILSNPSRRSMIILADNHNIHVNLIYRANTPPERSSTLSAEYALMQFAGRKYPVAEYGEHEIREKSLTYSLRERNDLETLKSLVGHTVIWVDKNERFFACMSELRHSEHRGYVDVSFTLTEVDYNEEIEYE